VAEQSEWDGPLHGFRGAVVGLSGTEDVLDVEEGDLDGPSCRVAGDDLLRVAVRSVVTSAMSYPPAVLVLVVLPVSRTRMTRTVSVRHTPYHKQTCSVISTVLVAP
jgi:hypothetical protein